MSLFTKRKKERRKQQDIIAELQRDKTLLEDQVKDLRRACEQRQEIINSYNLDLYPKLQREKAELEEKLKIAHEKQIKADTDYLNEALAHSKLIAKVQQHNIRIQSFIDQNMVMDKEAFKRYKIYLGS